MRGSAPGATGVSVTTGVTYYIDCYVDYTLSTHVVKVQVNGVAASDETFASIADTRTTFVCGDTSVITSYDLYMDDVLASQTLADYPLGDGKVLAYVANADGTHTSTNSDIVHGTLATPVGADITVATTDVFNWVNARPILGGATDNTRLVNQRLTATTEYVEVDFEPTTEVYAPRALDVITADREASGFAGGFSVKLNDNGVENVIITRSAAAGTTTDKYATKHYNAMVGGGAWTLARFNALKARFGYSDDANPDQYWRGIMIEAEFSSILVIPGAATLTLTTFAPTVSTPRLVTPPAATLTLASFAPSVTVGVSVTPPTAALVTTTFAPSVLTPRLVTPPTTALIITAFVPSVLTPRLITPPLLALILATFAPDVTVSSGGGGGGYGYPTQMFNSHAHGRSGAPSGIYR